MKGIILKDFYENYIIRKNLINWILGGSIPKFV